MKRLLLFSVVLTILVLVCIHTVVLLYLFFLSYDIAYINAFSIVGLSLLYPYLEHGVGLFLLSWILVFVIFFGVFGVMYLKNRK